LFTAWFQENIKTKNQQFFFQKKNECAAYGIKILRDFIHFVSVSGRFSRSTAMNLRNKKAMQYGFFIELII
jgi:hypothetical protein